MAMLAPPQRSHTHHHHLFHHDHTSPLFHAAQEDMHRRARGESAAIQAQWAEQFRAAFDPYDWTKALG